jgi:hypothetical protein
MRRTGREAMPVECRRFALGKPPDSQGCGHRGRREEVDTAPSRANYSVKRKNTEQAQTWERYLEIQGRNQLSYEAALKVFKENRDKLSPESDPAMWNLNNGLYHLATALREDIHKIQQTLASLKR